MMGPSDNGKKGGNFDDTMNGGRIPDNGLSGGRAFSEKVFTVEEMRRRKRELGFCYEEIAKRAGLPLGTVQKVLGGFTKNPRHATLAALSKALFPEDGPTARGNAYSTCGGNSPVYGNDISAHGGGSTASESGIDAGRARQSRRAERAYSDLVCEGAPAYEVAGRSGGRDAEEPIQKEGGARRSAAMPGQERQGKYTIRDRNALPEDHPSELIDGVIYNMASPTSRHQLIAGAIYRQLWNYVDEHGGSCIPFIAPTDVRLDKNDYTMLVPDVFVVCRPDEEKMGDERYIDGAPDLVIEVLSPSTRSKDMFVKLGKYRGAGVREYWIVDPQKEKVVVYLFGDEPEVCLFGFDGEIPVGIWQSACKIDFRRITRELRMAHLL